MGLLEAQEEALAREMIFLRFRRDSLDDLTDRLTDEYARAARFLYRRRLLAPSATMLLMPEEHRRLALAERLFSRYAERQKERGRIIVALRDSLQNKDSLLFLRRNQQLSLLIDQRRQMEKLESLQKRYATELRRTEAEKGSLQAFLRRKNNEAKQIEGMISRLAARDKKESPAKAKPSKSREKPAAKKATEKKSTKKASGKSENKEARKSTTEKNASESGRTAPSSTAFRPAWPVPGRTILHSYGERKNAQTNTITFNPGINIAAQSGTSVTASASGKVSLVSWLPSYGTVVIVEHDGGWRTVYANLASADVSEGATVKKGGRIGRVGSSTDGDYLHFEIWHGQTRLNPATLLK